MGRTMTAAERMAPPQSLSDIVKRALKRSRDGEPQVDPSSDVPGSSKPGPAEGELGTEAVKPDAVAGPKPEEVSQPEASTTTVSAPEPTTSVKNVESSPTDLLKNLIDMTHVPSGTEPAHFNSIAQTLMQDFELCVTSKSSTITAYEFLEVEFYWYNQQIIHFVVAIANQTESSTTISHCIMVKGTVNGNRELMRQALDIAARGRVQTTCRIEPLARLPDVFEELRGGKLAGRVVLDLWK
ncbi:unnamed protein product [Rhizoctonia solani]|uniref:Alcohol dehydrogenase-like C-terminal domain-containing protein n=1 Tax=Rhizoctonia solani TaxID=456999 RepID=A0A8H3DX10_9AGAM|nr:unnamed protein product [Rhizoctonia solani]